MFQLSALKDELARRKTNSSSSAKDTPKANKPLNADPSKKARRSVFSYPVTNGLKSADNPTSITSGKRKRAQKEKPVDVEEQRAWEKAKIALNKKAKLYEDLHNGSLNLPEHAEEACLVDFTRKVVEQPYRPVVEATTPSSHTGEKPLDQCDLVSSDMWREDRRKKWEEEVDPNGPVHYQQVLGDEIRDHGVAYFKFSADEDKRQEEMMELNTLRMQTRISRLNKGLETSSSRVAGENEHSERDILPTKVKLARPWDADKKPPPPMPSWEQRIENARADRPAEFAPPVSYNNTGNRRNAR